MKKLEEKYENRKPNLFKPYKIRKIYFNSI